MTLTFDLLTLKVVSESRVTGAITVPILVFLGLSVLDLGRMYATDVRQKHRLMPPSIRGGGIIIVEISDTFRARPILKSNVYAYSCSACLNYCIIKYQLRRVLPPSLTKGLCP